MNRMCLKTGVLLALALSVRLAGQAQTLPPLPPDLLYDETFAHVPPGHYAESSGPRTRTELTPAGYHVAYLLTDNSLINQATNTPGHRLNLQDDFAIEAELNGQGSVGIYWGGRGLSTGNEFYIFQLELPQPGGGAVGSVWQLAQPGGRWTKLAEGNLAPSSDAWHHLRVQRQGAQVSYYANGVLLGQHAWQPGTVGRDVGVFVQNPGADLTLHHLKLWHHQPPLRLVHDLPGTRRPEHLAQLSDPKLDEGQVLVSADGRLLSFFRMVNAVSSFKSNIRDTDIYFSQLQADGKWGAAYPAGWPLNNVSANSVEHLSTDGQELLLLNQYEANGGPSSRGGLSHSRRNAQGSWSVPTGVGPADAPTSEFSGQEVAYSFDAGGELVVLAKDAAIQPGVNDLYVLRRGADGRLDLASAQSLGPTLNTPYNEIVPFLAPDGRTLYFASDGHPGYGGLDIFVTRRLDDSWTNWSPPLNLGPAVNTAANESEFCVTAAGDFAYYIGRGPQGSSDIFRLRLTPESRPTATRLVRGRVLDVRSGQPVPAARVAYERLPAGTALGSTAVADGTGRFELVLPSGAQYGFRAEAAGYVPALGQP